MTPHRAPGYRQLRAGRRSIAGQLYLLTTVTHHRRAFFLDPVLASTAARTLSDATIWLPSRCLAWVLMPDHWHALVELGEKTQLSAAVGRMKGVASHVLKQQCKFSGPLWAKGFHDHALRRDESVEQVARYIVANPLRAGLVNDVLDYPYWDAWFITEGLEF